MGQRFSPDSIPPTWERRSHLLPFALYPSGTPVKVTISQPGSSRLVSKWIRRVTNKGLSQHLTRGVLKRTLGPKWCRWSRCTQLPGPRGGRCAHLQQETGWVSYQICPRYPNKADILYDSHGYRILHVCCTGDCAYLIESRLILTRTL